MEAISTQLTKIIEILDHTPWNLSSDAVFNGIVVLISTVLAFITAFLTVLWGHSFSSKRKKLDKRLAVSEEIIFQIYSLLDSLERVTSYKVKDTVQLLEDMYKGVSISSEQKNGNIKAFIHKEVMEKTILYQYREAQKKFIDLKFLLRRNAIYCSKRTKEKSSNIPDIPKIDFSFPDELNELVEVIDSRITTFSNEVETTVLFLSNFLDYIEARISGDFSKDVQI